MPEFTEVLIMFAAFVLYFWLSGWSRHRQQHRPPKQWWGRGR